MSKVAKNHNLLTQNQGGFTNDGVIGLHPSRAELCSWLACWPPGSVKGISLTSINISISDPISFVIDFGFY